MLHITHTLSFWLQRETDRLRDVYSLPEIGLACGLSVIRTLPYSKQAFFGETLLRFN